MGYPDLEHIIYDTVVDANRKISPGELEKTVHMSARIDRKRIRAAIKHLVDLGELRYTYLYGTSNWRDRRESLNKMVSWSYRGSSALCRETLAWPMNPMVSGW